jgi:uncharacterized protein YndB with AHSA1/START domain
VVLGRSVHCARPRISASRTRSLPDMSRRPVVSYRNAYEFPQSPEGIWEALEEVNQFVLWWPWLEEFRLEGGSLVTGAMLSGVVAPPLPYRMRVEIELTRCEKPGIIEALVRRDLEGEASVALSSEGAGTRVEVAWTLEMMQRPMRLADRMAHPMLKRGHDRVVEKTVAEFRSRLGAVG